MPWYTLSGSNYPCLEQISMVSKMFEPLRFDCMNKDTQEMPQSWTTAFPRRQKKDRWGTNNNKANITYKTSGTRTKNFNRRTTLERSVEKYTRGRGRDLNHFYQSLFQLENTLTVQMYYLSSLTLMSYFMTKPTKWHVRPAKTQISLGFRPVLGKDSDQPRQPPSLISLFCLHEKKSLDP